ncbi:MAG TPA: GNAT family N-acetyltransferase, partial [Roseiflexaceae bacterium]|nr:GNAT family N-acetyltransferase [Roseiflexaceae bacterium]
AINSSVAEKAGAQHFEGVTVQPMVKLEGYELIVGASTDPQFGPVLLFGTGGQLVEVFKDRALALPPLNTTLARRMMEQTRIYTALQGVRGRPPVDLGALEHLLVAFSQLVAEQRWIKEIDVNPLLASPERLIALDARVVAYEAEVGEDALPKLAVRPYPTQYVTPWTLKNGTPVTIRPIRPEDEPLLVKFHETLSERSVYMRYFSPLKLSQRVAHERLTRICFVDYDREMALVVEHHDPQSGERQVLAVGRLVKLRGANEAEYAILVNDQWQGQGIGSELLRRLIQIGRDEQVARIIADILPDNQPMQQISTRLGFKLHRPASGPVRAVLDL